MFFFFIGEGSCCFWVVNVLKDLKSSGLYIVLIICVRDGNDIKIFFEGLIVILKVILFMF